MCKNDFLHSKCKKLNETRFARTKVHNYKIQMNFKFITLYRHQKEINVMKAGHDTLID